MELLPLSDNLPKPSSKEKAESDGDKSPDNGVSTPKESHLDSRLLQEALYLELRNLSPGQAERIAFHVQNGADLAMRFSTDDFNYDEPNSFEVLFEAFMSSKGEEAPRICVETVRALIDLGADPTALGSEYLPVLHKAVESVCPTDVLEVLLEKVDINVLYHRFKWTPLSSLLNSERPFSMDYVEFLIDKGTNLEAGCYEESGEWGMTPLDQMAGLEENSVDLISLIARKRPDLLQKYCNSMLWTAVESGSLETVKVLCSHGASITKADDIIRDSSLILIAARSTLSSTEKFNFLIDQGADPKATALNLRNAVHIAAASRNVQILTRALEMGVDHLAKDGEGNLPIHFAIGNMKCLKLLIEKGSPLNIENNNHESCLAIALQSRATECVGILLEAGGPELLNSKLKNLEYPQLSILAEPKNLAMSTKPLMTMLRLNTLFAKCADHNESHAKDFRSLAESMELLAVEMLENARVSIPMELLTYGIENEQKLFISCSRVQDMIVNAWYGVEPWLSVKETVTTLQYVRKVSWYLVRILLIPFALVFWLPFLWCDYEKLSERWMKEQPCIVFVANAVSYLFFVALVVADVSLKSSQNPATEPSALDWIILVFVLALILQEVAQLLQGYRGKKKNYFKSWSNIFDIILIVTFLTYYLCLFAGYYGIEDGFSAIRTSFHVLGIASLISCVRFLSYLQVHIHLGPIQASFVRIFYEVVLFLIVLGVFLVGFAVSMTSVYSAKIKSSNASFNVTSLDAASGVFSSLTTLFWALFGLVDLDDFSAENQSYETTVGMILLALWLLIAVIILLNMLIALISNVFQKIQDNADVEWKFARACMINDIIKSPPTPIPINLLHFPVEIISRALSRETFTLNVGNFTDLDLMYALNRKIAESEEEQVTTKDLREHIDEQSSALKKILTEGLDSILRNSKEPNRSGLVTLKKRCSEGKEKETAGAAISSIDVHEEHSVPKREHPKSLEDLVAGFNQLQQSFEKLHADFVDFLKDQ
eukprot:m.294767 g.294767  ORF g.294767 m.294767 type:complete len:999 (+) comp40755_c0_seq55:585-3581(+)